MKNRITKIIMACLLIVLGACDVDKLTSLKDDFKISMTPDAVISKTTIEVKNANGGEKPISGTISFSGEGAEYVYTPEGSKEFVINEGIVTVGVLSTANITEDEPISVLATIAAEGYETQFKEILFTGEDDFKYLTATLIEEGNLPSGVKINSQSVSLSGGATTSEIIIENTDSNANDDVEISIPEGTVIKDDEGNIISESEVTFELKSYDLSNENTLGALPEGGFIYEDELSDDDEDVEILKAAKISSATNSTVVDQVGDVILPISNLTSFYLKTRTGRRYYRSRSRHCSRSWWGRRRCHYHYYYRYYSYTIPVTIKKYIDSNVINPITGNKLIAGDIVNVYKYQGSTYYKYGSVRVLFDGGVNKLFVKYTTGRDGRFLFGFSPSQVDNCSLNSLSQLTLVNKGLPQAYKFVVTNSSGAVQSYAYTYVGGGRVPIRLSWLPHFSNTLRYLNNSNMRLKVFTANGNKKVFDRQISLCEMIGGAITLDGTSDCVYNANLDMNIECPSVNLVLNYVPVFYKKTSDLYFKRFGYVSKGYIKGLTPCLDETENYQFRVLYDNQWRESPVKTGSEVKAKSIGFDNAALCEFIEEQLNK